MKSNKVIIFSDGDRAIDCHRFFTKYGFEVAFFVFGPKIVQEAPFDVAVFQFNEMGDEKLVNADCPIIVASSDSVFISAVKKRLESLMINEHQVFVEPLIYSGWLEELVDALSFNSANVPNEFVAHLLDTHPAALADGPRTAEVLARYASQRIQRYLNPSQKTLAVYYPSSAYRTNLGSEEMYDKIRKQGYNVIFLFGVLCDDEFEKRKFSYYAGHDIVNSLDFVDVFVIPTVMLGLPERAKKVLFVHDIYDSPSGKAELPRASAAGEYPRESPFIDELDYVFVPCAVLMGENKIHRLVRKKPLCTIPGGYMKLDHNLRYFDSNKVGVDSIIYAPTVTDGDFAEYVSVPEYGQSIVCALLESFPSYRIIFRPHPHTLDTEDVRNIVERFRDNERFVFDSNASFYNDNYCRSAVMVTDMSGTGFTYAFMTLRPVVFFSHKEDSVAEAFNNVRYFEDREQIGCVATTIEELKTEVARALKDGKSAEQRIREFRDKVIFNLGRAEDYFAENFHYIAEGKKHEDWQYVVAPLSQSEARLLEPLHNHIDQYIEDIGKLKSELKNQYAAIRKSEKLVENKDCDIKNLLREAEDKDENITRLSLAIEGKNKKIEEVREQIFELERTMNEKKRREEDLLRESQERSDNIVRLSITIEQKNQAIEEQRKAIEQSESENRKLREMLDARDKGVEDLREELARTKSIWWFRLLSQAKRT